MCVDLQRKVALVTGASRGIGAAVARDMANHITGQYIRWTEAGLWCKSADAVMIYECSSME